MAQKTKPAQPKSDPTIADLQTELKRQGLYSGPVDGVMGQATKDAVAARDSAAQRNTELEIEKLKASSGKTTADAEAAATTAETERKQRYNDQASSGLGMATQSAANLAAPAAGTALGLALGKGVNYGMDVAQEGRNNVLRGVAADRMAGRTTVDGARTGAKLAGAVPFSNPVARTASRMLPHTGLGLLSMGKGAQVLHESDPNGEFYPQMADRAAGLGYIGTGVGLTKQGLRYAAAPGVTPDAQALAIINSNQIRRNGAPGALAKALEAETIDITPNQPQAALPAPAASKADPKPGSADYMRRQLREDFDVKGISKTPKTELAKMLAEKMQEHGSKRTVARKIPKVPGGTGGAAGLAAALAYAATPDRADAATGQSTGNQAEALTNAGLAGGIAAGTGYGVGKLAEALSPMVGPAISTGNVAMAPSTIDGMTDYSPDELAQARNWMARNMPQALQGGAVSNAREMAQVPSRGPLAQALMAGR